jgi:amidophosphoribosyltransferase
MCGIFAVSSKENILNDLYIGTFYLQHRGQQYAGLSTNNGDDMIKIRTHRGMVRETFAQDLIGLEGTLGIGHTALKDRQPIKLDSKMGEFTIAFEGNIINAKELTTELKKQGHSFYSHSDIEIIAKLIAQGEDFVDGITKMAEKIRGAYALVLLAKGRIYAARDQHGFRPMVIGRRDGAVAVSSESCSFINMGFNIERDVKPGEIIEINDSQYTTKKIIESDLIQYCTFEWVYTANAASIIDGVAVDIARKNLGGCLAKRFPVAVDVVGAVPNSGIGHAIGYAQESKIPFDNVFLKYDYASRSYTQPTQEERDREAKIKLIPVPAKIQGRKVVICDDSIVRGTQMKNDLVVKLRKNGVKEIHARIACPPLKAPCMYGVATRSKSELVAHEKTVEELKEYMGLDGLGFNTLEDLETSIGKPLNQLCLSCWTDAYRV